MNYNIVKVFDKSKASNIDSISIQRMSGEKVLCSMSFIKNKHLEYDVLLKMIDHMDDLEKREDFSKYEDIMNQLKNENE